MIYKILLATLLFPWMGLAEVKTDTNALRLENLLIWKLADELALSSQQELSFSKVIKNLGQEKREIQDKIESLTAELKNNPKKINEYKKQLENLALQSRREIDEVEKVLGKDKTAKYIYLKNEILKRIALEFTKKEEPDNSGSTKK